MNARYVLIPRFAEITGYTDKAVRRKIEEGVWIEGRQFRRAPDGRILIDARQYAEDLALANEPAWDERRRRFKIAYETEAAEEVVAITSGVYLLMLGGDVAYVGRSTSLRSRLATHRASGREFDEARIIPCDAEVSVWLEKELIRTLQPAQNRLRYARHAAQAERALVRGGLQ